MKAKEIETALISGERVTVSSFMKFSRGKLVRGSLYVYKVGSVRISERQFSKIMPILMRINKDEVSTKTYISKDFYYNTPF